ncbi:MAG TPA: hypothetical protein VFE57_02270 [Cyclobacteriaceae bacterium]|nr:hypothetical protein [Cyclobacteriaceae bacterium]
MRSALITGFTLIGLAGCLSDALVTDYKDVPRNVDRYIHDKRINPIKISRVEYSVQSSVGYLIDQNGNDMFIILVDSDGNYICAPSGGFTGSGDGKCPDFYKSLKSIETVWESK